MYWLVIIVGIFELLLEFKDDYPNTPPAVRFVNKVYHPNGIWIQVEDSFLVYGDGRICLDILQSHWSPVNDVSAVLLSIQVVSMTVHFIS